jgi:hypothetical protein
MAKQPLIKNIEERDGLLFSEISIAQELLSKIVGGLVFDLREGNAVNLNNTVKTLKEILAKVESARSLLGVK